jgi:hypothetical protein
LKPAASLGEALQLAQHLSLESCAADVAASQLVQELVEDVQSVYVAADEQARRAITKRSSRSSTYWPSGTTTEARRALGSRAQS